MTQLPFTVDQFFDVFRRYNEAVWPLQLMLYLLALVAVGLATSRSARRTGGRGARLVSAILGLLWLWMGVAYHLLFFRGINPAATLFGTVFIVQAALFIWAGAWHAELAFAVRRDARGVLGGLIIAYGLVVYPILGVVLGHRYPAAPTFGLPCPTTIFTLGMLLWTTPPVPRALLVVPVLWAGIATSAALQLGVHEDLGLPVAAALAMIVLLGRRHRPSHTSGVHVSS